MKWLSKLFGPRDRRRSRRHSSPPLMAFYWDGGSSTPHPVPDLSHTGFFIKTADRWFPRTLVRVTLQRRAEDPEVSTDSITVQCRVVRTGDDGVGMAIMLAEEDQSEFPATLGSLATRRQLNEFFERVLTDATEPPIPEHPYLPFPDLEQITAQANLDDRDSAREKDKKPTEKKASQSEPDFPEPAPG